MNLIFLYVIPLSPRKIKRKFIETRVPIPIQWPNAQLTLRILIPNIKLKCLYVIALSPIKIKGRFIETRVPIPIEWPNAQLTFMFRVNFCRWFALISQKKLLFKLISLDIIKLRFHGNGFTHVFWPWNYFSISHRIQFLQCISFLFCTIKFTHKIIHRHSRFYNYLYTYH